MNCSLIAILPSKKKRMSLPEGREPLAKRNVEFPEFFLANIGEVSGGCTTSEALNRQIVIAYPNPGSSVERPEGDSLFKQPCKSNPRAKAAAGGSGGDKRGKKTPQAQPWSTSSSPQSSSSASTESTLTAFTTVTPTVTTLFPFPSSSTLISSTKSTMSSALPPCPFDSDSPTTSDSQCTEGQLTCLDDGIHFATCTGRMRPGINAGPDPVLVWVFRPCELPVER
ncbi:hypothetical protein HD806DRAFT_514036 [Xylariaceae sp. AK1471]|nr:hypothetical protein HD806DRAFT_514036 [Xylariaceae sp. AK1471]